MLGIFGTLNLATRSLSTQRVGTEVAGHNLANVNNPAYARQRVEIETSLTVPSNFGPQGSGAQVTNVRQLRDALLDGQIRSETSVRGWLDAQQQALQYAQANLGQDIDRQASGVEGTAAAGAGGQHGIAETLSEFFNAWQSLSTNPTSSAERQVLLLKAEDLALQFNQVSERLANVNTSLNEAVSSDVQAANDVLADVAKLNQQIVSTEIGGAGVANDLRDRRQQRVEELAELVNLTAIEQSSGALNIVVDGQTLVADALVVDQLEAFDPGNGQLQLRTQTGGAALTLTGGTVQGAIDARDGALTDLRTRIDQLAGELISEANTLHAAGFDLAGNTGEAFFTGTDAATFGVNTVLTGDPGRIQAAATAGTPGDNRVALSLAQLGDRTLGALGNQTLRQHYGQTVAGIGQSLASVNSQRDNQQIVESMLLRQRDSTSGVSLDEEMTDLIRFQRAFEASARLVGTLDEMLATVVNLGR